MDEKNKGLENIAYILNPIANANGVLTSTDQVFDVAQNMTQAQINERAIVGSSIESIKEFYAVYPYPGYEGTDMKSDPEITWVQVPGLETFPQMTVENPYLWNYEIFYQADGSEVETEPKVVGTIGRGIQTIQKRYLVNNIKNELPNKGYEVWLENSPATDDKNPYLWERQRIFYTGNLDETKPDEEFYTLIGVKGEAGIDGLTVEYIFCVTKSRTEAPGKPGPNDYSGKDTAGEKEFNTPDFIPYPRKADWDTRTETEPDYYWSDEPQGVSKEYPAQWICQREQYTDGELKGQWKEFSDPKLYSTYGVDAVSVEKIETWYAIAKTNDPGDVKEFEDANEDTDPTTPETWHKNSPNVTKNYKYLWKKTITYWSEEGIDDPTTEGDESKVKETTSYEVVGSMGDPGIDGDSVEWIYTRTKTSDRPALEINEEESQTRDYIPRPNKEEQTVNGVPVDYYWSDDIQSVDEVYPYGWRSQRKKTMDDNRVSSWSEFSEPVSILYYAKDGADGISPAAYYKSMVFCRSNSQPQVPSSEVITDTENNITYNTYENPIPPRTNGIDWYDGIPNNGSDTVWSSTRIFSSISEENEKTSWSTPQVMVDTADMEIMYSAWGNGIVDLNDDIFAGFNKDDESINKSWLSKANSFGWYDNPEDCVEKDTSIKSGDPTHMAITRKSGGKWSRWEISKIKGERGKDGTSIDISKRYETEEEFRKEWSVTTIDENGEEITYWYSPDKKGYKENTSFVVAGNLWIWNGSDEWYNIGRFRGDDSFLHVFYASHVEFDEAGKPTRVVLTHIEVEIPSEDGSEVIKKTIYDGSVPGKYIASFANNAQTVEFPEDEVELNTFLCEMPWKKWIGEDGFGYEYIYKLSNKLVPGSIETPESILLPTYSDPENPDYVPSIDNIPEEFQKKPGEDGYEEWKERNSNWYDNPPAIDEENPFCWQAYRIRREITNPDDPNFGKTLWGEWQGTYGTNTPALWSKFSKDGNSLISIKTEYCISSSQNKEDVMTYSTGEEGTDTESYKPLTWYPNSPKVTDDFPYLWKKTTSEYSKSVPTENGEGSSIKIQSVYELIGQAGEKGIDGNNIEWAYKLTKTDVCPTSRDTLNVPLLKIPEEFILMIEGKEVSNLDIHLNNFGDPNYHLLGKNLEITLKDISKTDTDLLSKRQITWSSSNQEKMPISSKTNQGCNVYIPKTSNVNGEPYVVTCTVEEHTERIYSNGKLTNLIKYLGYTKTWEINLIERSSKARSIEDIPGEEDYSISLMDDSSCDGGSSSTSTTTTTSSTPTPPNISTTTTTTSTTSEPTTTTTTTLVYINELITATVNIKDANNNTLETKNLTDFSTIKLKGSETKLEISLNIEGSESPKNQSNRKITYTSSKNEFIVFENSTANIVNTASETNICLLTCTVPYYLEGQKSFSGGIVRIAIIKEAEVNSGEIDWPTGEVTGNIPGEWSDDALDVSETWQFQWVIKRTMTNGLWGPWGIEETDDNGIYYKASLNNTFGNHVKIVHSYFIVSNSNEIGRLTPDSSEYSSLELYKTELTKLNWVTENNDDLTVSLKNNKLYELNIFEFTDGTFTVSGPTARGLWSGNAIQSTVFCRSNALNVPVPEGGNYSHPYPNNTDLGTGEIITWSDGIPKYETGAPQTIWSSTAIFTPDKPNDPGNWSKPIRLTDTSTLQIRYNPSLVEPGKPGDEGNENGWTNEPSYYSIWMATRTMGTSGDNGDYKWSEWTVTKIKGETGRSGARQNLLFNAAFDSVQPSHSRYWNITEPNSNSSCVFSENPEASGGVYSVSLKECTLSQTVNSQVDGKRLMPNTTYVLSFNVKQKRGDSGERAYVDMTALGGLKTIDNSIVLNYSDGLKLEGDKLYILNDIEFWEKHFVTFTTDNNSESTREISFNAYSVKSLQLHSIKLEEGSEFTDFSKAPEDFMSESPIIADLDNEMDSFKLTHDGKADQNYEFITNVGLWCGIDPVTITACTVSSLDDIVLTPPKDGDQPWSTNWMYSTETQEDKRIKVSFKVKGGEIISKSKYSFKISLSSVDVTRDLIFTLNAISSGAAIYRLQTNTNQIIKDRVGNILPAKISCKAVISVENTTQDVTGNDGVYIKYCFGDGNGGFGEEKNYNFGENLDSSIVETPKNIKFILYQGETILDSETIPFIIDGTEGLSSQENLLDNTSFERLRENGLPTVISCVTGGANNGIISHELISNLNSGIHKNAIKIIAGEPNTVQDWRTQACCYSKLGEKLSLNTWYTFSFYSKYVEQYSTTTGTTDARIAVVYIKDSESSMYFDGVEVGGKQTFKEFILSSTWSRHWITFKTPLAWSTESSERRIDFGIKASKKNSYAIAMPKLELLLYQDSPQFSPATPWCSSTGDNAGQLTSTVFLRSDDFLNFSAGENGYDLRPLGGTYKQPYPDNPRWEIGIPSEGKGTFIYSSSCNFWGDNTSSGWSTPQLLSDSSELEVMYSPIEGSSAPEIPTGFNGATDEWFERAKDWYDELDGTFDPIWMATNNRGAGNTWSDNWVVTRIRSEIEPNPNLFRNTNFDVYDGAGKPTVWTKIVPENILDKDYNGLNSYQWNSGFHLYQKTPKLIPGKYYTISFYYRSNFPTNVNGIACIINHKLGEENVNSSSNYWSDSWKNQDKGESWFKGTEGNWEKAYIKFKYSGKTVFDGNGDLSGFDSTVSEELSIEFYTISKEINGVSTTSIAALSQIKFEEGSRATSYNKNQEDLKAVDMISAQLTNEMDSIPLDSDGHAHLSINNSGTVVSGLVTSYVGMFSGVTQLNIDEPTINYSSKETDSNGDTWFKFNNFEVNFAKTPDKEISGGITDKHYRVRVRPASYNVDLTGNHSIPITVVNTEDNTIKKTVTLVINGIPGGKHAKLYKIIPNLKTLKKNDAGEFIEKELYCRTSVSVNGVISYFPKGTQLRYFIDDSTTPYYYYREGISEIPSGNEKKEEVGTPAPSTPIPTSTTTTSSTSKPTTTTTTTRKSKAIGEEEITEGEGEVNTIMETSLEDDEIATYSIDVYSLDRPEELEDYGVMTLSEEGNDISQIDLSTTTTTPYPLPTLINRIDLTKLTIEKYIKFELIDSYNQVVDVETVPVLVDGLSSISADLDNEMESIPLRKNPDGTLVVDGEHTLKTTVWICRGATELKIDNVTLTEKDIILTEKDGITQDYNENHTKAEISFVFEDGDKITWTKKEITITIKSGNYSKNLVFKINAIQPGADGEAAVIYKLIPSVKQIKKKNDGTYSPAGNLTFQKVKVVGGTQSAADDTTVKIKVSKDGGNYTDYTSSGISPNSFIETVTAVLYSGTWTGNSSTVPSNVMVYDTETIGIVKNGLSTGTNLIKNSNFDVYDESGALKYYNRKNGTILAEKLYGFNIFQTKNINGIRLEQKITLEPNQVYTLSCMAKNVVGTTYPTQVSGWCIFAPDEATNDESKRFKSTDFDFASYIDTRKGIHGGYEFYTGGGTYGTPNIKFGPTPDWEEKSITFKYKGQRLENVNLALAYTWSNGEAYYSQLKFEVGEEATEYSKNPDDYEVTNYTVQENLLDNTDFSKLKSTTDNSNGLPHVIYCEWGGTNSGIITYEVIPDSNSGIHKNAIKITAGESKTDQQLHSQTCCYSKLNGKLSLNTWYTFSFYSKYIDKYSSATTITDARIGVVNIKDSDSSMYFDGTVVENKNSYKLYTLSPTWTRHWITFKTPTSWTTASNAVFRIDFGIVKADKKNSYAIAMPKLELAYHQTNPEHSPATAWCESSNDKKPPFTSTVFIAASSPITGIPTGGSYDDPKPTGGWSDGIPANNAGKMIYSSSRKFDAVLGGLGNWSEPRLMSDSETFDVQYSTLENPQKTDPLGTGWFDPTSTTNKVEDAIWMATRSKTPGSSNWGNWIITRIVGEKGDPGVTPLIADLDNEMDSIALPSTGMLANSVTLTTTVGLWRGVSLVDNYTVNVTNPNTSKFTILVKPEGSSSSSNTTPITTISGGKKAVITYTALANIDLSGAYISTITLTDNNNQTRELTFTINGIKAGSDGQAAVTYQLIPTINQFVYDPDTSKITTNTVKFTVTKSSGSTQSTIESSSEDLTIQYITSGGNSGTVSSWSTGYTLGNSSLSYVKFSLKKGTTVVDTETIPIIKNGPTGATGGKGDKGDTGAAAVMYKLIPSVDKITKNEFGDVNPTKITCKYSSKSGTDNAVENSQSTTYPGYYIYYSTNNGTSWTKYDTTSGITVSKGITGMDIELRYYTSSTSSFVRLDTTTIPVINSGPGPMMCPAGNWTAGKNYKRTETVCDMVAVDQSDGSFKYYFCKQSHTSSDSITTSNTTYWQEISQYEALYTKFLMANWAMFGGENGSVFYDRYLFSQHGLANGVGNGTDSYDKRYMFEHDCDGNLVGFSGSFIPNLALNFLTGELITTQFTEYTTEITGKSVIKMDDTLKNIIVTPTAFSGYDGTNNINDDQKLGCSAPLIILPQITSGFKKILQNGTRVSIYAKYSDMYINQMKQTTEDINSFKSDVFADSITGKGLQYTTAAFALISAEDITNGNDLTSNIYGAVGRSWIIWKGFRSKFLLLSPGNSIRLKLVVQGENKIYWFVENPDEFELGDIDIIGSRKTLINPSNEWADHSNISVKLPRLTQKDITTTEIVTTTSPNGLVAIEKQVTHSYIYPNDNTMVGYINDGKEINYTKDVFTMPSQSSSTILDKYYNWTTTDNKISVNSSTFSASYDSKIFVSKGFCGEAGKYKVSNRFGGGCYKSLGLIIYNTSTTARYRLYINSVKITGGDQGGESTGGSQWTTIEPNKTISSNVLPDWYPATPAPTSLSNS